MTGLGSIDVEAGLEKSPAMLTTCTGTVSGWNLGRVKVTVKFSAGTETEQGVLQPGPSEVTASAPDGIESIWTGTVGSVGFRKSVENDEQPPAPSATMALTMTRRMMSPPLVAAHGRSPPSTIGARQCRSNGTTPNH